MNQNDSMLHNNQGCAKNQDNPNEAIRKYQLKQISFDREDNWADHKDLQVKIPWKTADVNNSPILDEATINSTNPFMDNSKHPLVFEATVNDQLWVIRLNNFPDYPLFTLMIAQDQIMHEIIHFNDWPTFWGKCPALLKLPKRK